MKSNITTAILLLALGLTTAVQAKNDVYDLATTTHPIVIATGESATVTYAFNNTNGYILECVNDDADSDTYSTMSWEDGHADLTFNRASELPVVLRDTSIYAQQFGHQAKREGSFTIKNELGSAGSNFMLNVSCHYVHNGS